MKKNKLIKGMICVFIGIGGITYNLLLSSNANNENTSQIKTKSNVNNKGNKTIDVNFNYSNEVRDIYFKLLQDVFEWDETLDYMEDYFDYNKISLDDVFFCLDLIDEYTETIEQEWAEFETGMFIFEDVLFSHPDVKSMLGSNPTEEKKIAVKKKLIFNIDKVEKLYDESLSKHCDFDAIFEKYFDRKPTSKEKEWLKNKKTIKYSLYGGGIGKEITNEQKSLIDKGKGYTLCDDDLYLSGYNNMIKLRREYIPVKIKFRQIYDVFIPTKDRIEKEVKLNIFEMLSDVEREEIYTKCKKDYDFDYEKAYKLCMEKLKANGAINDSSIKEEDNVTKPEDDMNKKPIEEWLNESSTIVGIQDYEKNQMTEVAKAISGDISSIYISNKDINKKQDIIFIEYNGIAKNTGVTISSDNKLNMQQVDTIFKCLRELIELKEVVAKEKILILFNNKIAIFEMLKEKDDKTEKIKFTDLSNILSKLDVKLYIKNN